MHKLYVLIAITTSIFILSSMTIDLQNFFNYANQETPEYITKDNTGSNIITDEGATLGRVLFYDKSLSSNNTIACASCHIQEFAFGDTSLVSIGVNGTTGRHSMRLVNNRFMDEEKYFWDERAANLEKQATMPIMDHVEMGYSGTNGDADFNDLIEKLETLPYYQDLFYTAFGETQITENKIQLALAQFVRSIQSFDAPYDVGRTQVDNDLTPFPNFNNQQNNGKNLFISPAEFNNQGLRIGGGLGCAGCHRPPEFDIVPDSKSNGVVFTPGNTMPNGGVDTLVFKSPSLRDVVNQDGQLNGQLMHTANFVNLMNVLNHYDRINLFPQVQGIADAIDDRLLPNGFPQDLDMTNQEKNQVIAFLGTLTGSNIYTDEKWSNPFDENGDLEIINSPLPTSNEEIEQADINLYPNPVQHTLYLTGELINTKIEIYNLFGKRIYSAYSQNNEFNVALNDIETGMYVLLIKDKSNKVLKSIKINKI